MDWCRCVRCAASPGAKSAGGAVGLAIVAGYGGQTIGLQHITSSESAFLTALYVPAVPLLQWLVLRRAPRHDLGRRGAGLHGPDAADRQQPASISFSYGQLITIAGAVAIAAEILLISHYARSVDLRRVTVLQLAVASIAAFALMPLAGETEIPPFSWTLTGLAVALAAPAR